MKFKIYFKQINADMFEIEAPDKISAISMAKEEWYENYKPEISSVEIDMGKCEDPQCKGYGKDCDENGVCQASSFYKNT